MTINLCGKEIDAIIFDLERTLYPPEEADRIFAAARKQLAIALLAGPESLGELPRDIVDEKIQELVVLADQIGWSQAYLQLGGDVDFYHRTVRGIDRSNGLEFNPVLHQMLSGLKNQVRLGLFTKATVPTTEAICTKILGGKWHSLFDAVVCDGSPGCPAEKPDPQAFKFILNQLGVSPEQVAMVGDSLADDILPAATLGMMTVMVGGEEIGPWELQIARIEELSSHLTNL